MHHNDKLVEIYTDGACSGNPGPGGWGAVLRYGGHEKEISGGAIQTTNNRMELQAVISALQQLKKPVAVRVHTDSKYVQQGIQVWIHQWRANGWKTAAKKPVKNVDLWQQLDALAAQRPIDWVWVKGHAGNVGNERADALARQGVDSVRRKQGDAMESDGEQ